MGLLLALAVMLQAASALGLWHPDPEAQAKEAENLLTWALTPADAEPAKALAKKALRRSPLHAEAAGLLAEAEVLGGRTGKAERMFRATTAIDHRDMRANLWLFNRALKARRYPEAFTYVDAVMRQDVKTHGPLMQTLYGAAGEPAAVQALGTRLALSPTWRGPFYAGLFRGPGRPALVYPLFEAMKAKGSAPTPQELQGYVDLLMRQGQYEQAYLAWLLSMTRADLQDIGYVYDGAFQAAPTIQPFGWVLGGGAGGSAALEEPPGGGRALLVNWDGYTASIYAQQQLVLPPGRYRLTGRIWASDNPALGGLAWTLTCMPRGPVVMKAPAAGSGNSWRRFSVGFEVPAGCKGQLLALVSESGERRTTMTIWYDDLTVESDRDGAGTEQP